MTTPRVKVFGENPKIPLITYLCTYLLQQVVKIEMPLNASVILGNLYFFSVK